MTNSKQKTVDAEGTSTTTHDQLSHTLSHFALSTATFFSLLFTSILVHDAFTEHLHGYRDWILLAVFAIATLVLVALVKKLWFEKYRLVLQRGATNVEQRVKANRLWAMLGFAFVTAHFLGVDSLTALRGGEVSWRLVLAAAIYTILAWKATNYSRAFPPVPQLREIAKNLKEEKPEQRPHLILFLSNLLPMERRTYKTHNALPTDFLQRENLGALIDRVFTAKKADDRNRWSWEMPLRAIQAHLAKLQTIVIIPSTQSSEDLFAFVEVLSYLEDLANVRVYACVHEQSERGHAYSLALCLQNGRIVKELSSGSANFGGVDFESFPAMYACIMCAVDQLGTAMVDCARHNQIMIDVTGGQKPTSIVGAAITFGRDIKAQYVQTEGTGTNGEQLVKSYDVDYAEQPALGH